MKHDENKDGIVNAVHDVKFDLKSGQRPLLLPFSFKRGSNKKETKILVNVNSTGTKAKAFIEAKEPSAHDS